MDFSSIKAAFATANSGGFDGVHFSVMGMAIVFGGLTLLAVYIALLPIIMNGFSWLKHRMQSVSGDKQSAGDTPGGIDAETLLAVATALHLELASADDNRKITWQRHDPWDSSWQRAGRFDAMNNQGHILAPRR